MKQKFLFSWKLLFSLAIMSAASSVYAQTDQQRTFLPSPNTASLGAFGIFPSVTSTGVPDISIPVYTVKIREISVPITLRYNPNLVQPDLHSGWVGLGWNLVTGGDITRVVNDKYDFEDGNGAYTKFAAFAGDDWATASRMATWKDKHPAPDQMPDEFSFSFLNYSGMFYIDKDRKWAVRSDDKLYVEGNVDGFTIRDPRGFTYIFGNTPESRELVRPFLLGDASAVDRVKTWKLTKIISPTGAWVEFFYALDWELLLPQLWWWNAVGGGNKLNFSGSQVKPSYLTGIKTSLEQLEFTRSGSIELKYDIAKFSGTFANWMPIPDPLTGGIFPLARLTDYGDVYNEASLQEAFDALPFVRLDKIKVSSVANGELLSEYNFTYNNDPNARMKLKRLEDTSGAIHRFFYTDDDDPTLKLPAYFANQMDHWGFYNGKDAVYTSFAAFKTSKQPNAAKLQCELLKTIIYPTGGITQYAFEPHTFSKEVAKLQYQPLTINRIDQIGGGIRIKSIRNLDENFNALDERYYVYKTGSATEIQSGPSTGVLSYGGSYYYFSDSWNTVVVITATPPYCVGYGGSTIVYSRVSETRLDGSYIVSDFSNRDNGVNNEYMDTPSEGLFNKSAASAWTSHADERGKLLSRKTYKINGSPVLQQEEINTYGRINAANEYVRAYGFASDFTSGEAVRINTYAYLPVTRIVKSYENGSTVTKQTDWTYDPAYKNLKTSSETDSRGVVWTTKYTYPVDLVTSAVSVLPVIEDGKPLNRMVWNKKTGVVLQQIKTFIDPATGQSQVVEGNLLTYKSTWIRHPEGDRFVSLPYENYVFRSAGKVAESSFTPLSVSSGAESLTRDSHFKRNTTTLYDYNGSVQQVQEAAKSPVSYAWGSQGSILFAEVKNAGSTTQIIPQTANGTGSIPISKSGNANILIGGFVVNVYSGTHYMTVDYTGTVKLKLGIQQNIDFTSTLKYSGDLGSGTQVIGDNGCGVTEITFTNINPGVYKLVLNITATAGSKVEQQYTLCGTVEYPRVNVVSTSQIGTREFFYEGFEENPDLSVVTSTSGAHTGSKYWRGDYTVSFAGSSSRTYKIEYWYLDTQGKWIYQSKNYSGTSMALTDGTSIDDVRIYPVDAAMTSYTHRATFGASSILDISGRAKYYEYDGTGRLRLIRDDDRNIIKQIKYNFKRPTPLP